MEWWVLDFPDSEQLPRGVPTYYFAWILLCYEFCMKMKEFGAPLDPPLIVQDTDYLS